MRFTQTISILIYFFQGVLLTEWADQRSAQFAVKSLNGYAFDKNHTFTARSFKDMKQLEAPSDHWTTPEKQAYNDVGDLWWWLQNERCRDQFAISHDKLGVPTVGVFTNMKGNDPELAGDADKAERAVSFENYLFLKNEIIFFSRTGPKPSSLGHHTAPTFPRSISKESYFGEAKTTLVPTVSLIPTFNTLISRRVRPTLLPTPLRKSRTAGETVRRIV